MCAKSINYLVVSFKWEEYWLFQMWTLICLTRSPSSPTSWHTTTTSTRWSTKRSKANESGRYLSNLVLRLLYLSYSLHCTVLNMFLHSRKFFPDDENCLFEVVNELMENEKMVEKYERMSSDLLDWIQTTIARLNQRSSLKKQIAWGQGDQSNLRRSLR